MSSGKHIALLFATRAGVFRLGAKLGIDRCSAGRYQRQAVPTRQVISGLAKNSTAMVPLTSWPLKSNRHTRATLACSQPYCPRPCPGRTLHQCFANRTSTSRELVSRAKACSQCSGSRLRSSAAMGSYLDLVLDNMRSRDAHTLKSR